MGSWGITMRESDYGLDLLGTIVGTQLKAVDFSTFNVADALEVIKDNIWKKPDYQAMRPSQNLCKPP